MTGRSLSASEVRLEIRKCLSNLRLDYLDRVYDRLPISERYLASDVNLHIHFAAGERMHCLTFEALNSVKVISFDAGMDSDSAIPDTWDEMPVFVRVGRVSQAPRPIASIIRLQPLDTCNMGGVDALEEKGCAASREILWRIHNRKLRAALLAAAIELSEFEDEVVQRGAEIIENLASQCADPHAEKGFLGKADIYSAMRRLWIEIEGDGVRLFLENDGDFPLKLRKVFVCPPYSFETAVERVTQIIGHGFAPPGVGLVTR